MNCVNCRINLQWALENLQEAALGGLQQGDGLEQAGRLVVRDPIAKWYHTDGGFKVLLLLLLGFIPLALALLFAWFKSTLGLDATDVYLVAAAIGLGAAVLWRSTVRTLRHSKPKPKVLRAAGLLILVPLILGGVGGVGYGLMRGMLVILPERSGRSLITQYNLGERDFSGVRLERADLSGARLHWADLSGADLSGANLSAIHIWDANLSGADLREAIMYQARLMQADLSGADLNGATLREADLREADLSGADLRRSDLSEADLSGADLSGADLCAADLSGALLSYANLKGAIVTAEQLAQVRSLDHATMPDGSVHE